MAVEVEQLLDAWCRTHLRSAVAHQFFGVQRISSVHGVRLDDGREVALKVRGAEPRQAACTAVQARLWEHGLPCPRPLAGPAPLSPTPVDIASEDGPMDAATMAVNAESWEGHGVASLGSGGAASWGRLAAGIVAAAPSANEVGTLAPQVPWLRWDHGDPVRAWPPPASHRWDPHRVDVRISPVIHDLVRRARSRLLRSDAATLPVVVGHGDLEAQNCRWVGGDGEPVHLVVHDWDSVVATSEAVIAGNTALSFASVADDAIATIEQTEQALAAYAEVRDRPWSSLEYEVAWATGAWVAAYNAAFEHLKDGPGPVTAAAIDQADERLARAGA
jgi:hypothetical protein